MAIVDEEGAAGYDWEEEGVYQLEPTDKLQGGAGGIANRQATELAKRTRNLHERLLLREQWQPEDIVAAIEGGAPEEIDTLMKLANWVLEQIGNIDMGAVSDGILLALRDGIASDYDTLKKLKDFIDTELAKDAARSELTGNDVNWAAEPVRTKTLTANTVLTFSNLIVNKTITLKVTGAFTLTLPASVTQIAGEYVGAKQNLVQLLCINAASPEVWCVISQPKD